jgi:Ser/Thr protein kinase RdoA (MazF antagonist)
VTDAHPYEALTPDVILSAVETFGWRCGGGLLALNSYENRVYKLDIETANGASMHRGPRLDPFGEDAPPVVAKFYRPQRWPDAAILEEHAFTRELAAHEIPVVAPLTRADGATLCLHAGFRFALFPWQPGRAPELNSAEDRRMLGRYLGRLHAVGRGADFAHRPRIDDLELFGREPVRYLLEHGFIPAYLEAAFRSLADTLLEQIETAFTAAAPYRRLRLHGDCHLGNILWTATGPHIVDFDDCRSGPAVQDLWMLLSGGRTEMEAQLGALLSGYRQFCDFNAAELALIEPLRTLRMLYYCSWLARRWDDPAFPRNFPWFNSERYWQDQILSLREQQALLAEPPLTWQPE